MSVMEVIIVAIASYLIGSIPFAVLISCIYDLGDITKFGSGNPGATNMMRLGGKKLAAATFLLDASKGALAVWLGKMFDAENAAFLFVIAGHCFSVFLKFKGGKGVATNFGGLFVLQPIAGLICAVLWVCSYLFFRISAVSAIISISITAIFSLIIWPEIATGVIIAAVLITYRHKSNIKKLLEEGKAK